MADHDDIKNVLFLCTHNSARSVMAEALLDRHGAGKFRAFSAGSQPSGRINPFVKSLLDRLDFDTSGFRSKDWREFAKPGAPAMQFVFTVCDDAAGEVCPVWPGQPMTAHWGFPDPSSFEGTDAEKAAFVAEVFGMIERRIRIFASLPLGSLSKLEIKRRIDDMGRTTEPA
ncbi:MAG: arsenate reductase ArsC [Proteobacteria bacterium]|nr:arsenate reductase ArsC [Pseudomonadota bacterium]